MSSLHFYRTCNVQPNFSDTSDAGNARNSTAQHDDSHVTLVRLEYRKQRRNYSNIETIDTFAITRWRHELLTAHFTAICSSAFSMISQKPMQLGSLIFTFLLFRSTNVPRRVIETHLFWGQKVKGQGHEAQKHCGRTWAMVLLWVFFSSSYYCNQREARAVGNGDENVKSEPA